MQSLVAAMKGQMDKEAVCAVTVFCAARLITSGLGYAELAKQKGIEAMLNILLHHWQFEAVVEAILKLCLDIASSRQSGIKLLNQKKAKEAVLVVLQNYENNPNIIISCTELLRSLANAKSANRVILHRCLELVLAAMRAHPQDAKLAIGSMRLLARACKNKDTVAFLKEKRASETIAVVLDSHYGNLELSTLATKILGQITGDVELISALKQLRHLSADLKKDPKKTELMEAMLLSVTLIECMASNAKAAQVIADEQGFHVFAAALKAVKGAKQGSLQERLLQHIATALSRLVTHKAFSEAIKHSEVVVHLLKACVKLVDYEEFVEETQHTLEILSRNSKIVHHLIDIDAAASGARIVAAHPLNDGILITACRFVARLAKGADAKHVHSIRQEGMALALIAVQRFLNSEDHLIDSLSSVTRLASLHQDGKNVHIAEENMPLFVKIVAKHKNSPSVMISAVGAYAALASDPEFAASFVQRGLLDEIVETLETYNDNEEYCAKALALLAKLCEGPKNLARLQELDVSGLIIETMSKHNKIEPVQLQGARALHALAEDSQYGVLLVEQGSIRVVFNALRTHPLSPNVVIAGLKFAHALAREQVNHTTLVAERTKEMIAWSMRAYPKNSELQEVCKATLSLLVKDAKEKEALLSESKKGHQSLPTVSNLDRHDRKVQLRKLVALMKTIKNTKAHPDTLALALRNLANSKASQDVMDEMIRHGGLARLVAIIETKSDNLDLLLPALKCIAKFANKGQHINVIVAYGGIGALIRALKKHMDKPDVLAPGIRLLGKLSVFNRLKVLIGLHGGTDNICMLYPWLIWVVLQVFP